MEENKKLGGDSTARRRRRDSFAKDSRSVVVNEQEEYVEEGMDKMENSPS